MLVSTKVLKLLLLLLLFLFEECKPEVFKDIPLADRLDVVIDTAAALAALEQALLHLALGALEEEHKLGLADLVLKGHALVERTREAVDQKVFGLACELFVCNSGITTG